MSRTTNFNVIKLMKRNSLLCFCIIDDWADYCPKLVYYPVFRSHSLMINQEIRKMAKDCVAVSFITSFFLAHDISIKSIFDLHC